MSLRFDRTNSQYVQVGDTSTFKWLHGAENPSGFKWSISFWYKAVNILSTGVLISNFDDAIASVGISIDIADNGGIKTIYVRIGRGGTGWVVSGGFSEYPNDGLWHNVILTYDQSLSANNLLCYLDGTLIGQTTKSGLSPSTANAYGVMNFGRNASGTSYSNAYLEDLRFYKDYVLSANEVKVIAKARGHDGIVNNLFARYEFRDGYDGEPTGKTVLLLHGDGSEGSKAIKDYAYDNKAVTVYGNAQVVEGVNKFGGSAIKFDGNGSYLSLADSDDWYFGAGDFTIDFWARFFFNLSAAMTFAQQNTGIGDNWWAIWKKSASNGNKLVMAFMLNGVYKGYAEMLYNWDVSIGIWYHIAFVRSGSNAFIFINGIQQPLNVVVPFGSNDVGNIQSVLGIGAQPAYPPGIFLYGYLDEFRITKGSARWVKDFTPPHQEYFSEIADTSGKGLYTFVSSASAPRFRGGELATQRRYRRW